MAYLNSEPTIEDIEWLRLALVEHFRSFANDAILGAQLGTKLNSLLAPNTYKSWLNQGNQNLKGFVEKFLNGIVTPTAQRQGLDYLFQIEGKPRHVVQTFGGALWKAFCLIRPTQAIRFEPKGGTLYLAAFCSDEATEHPTIEPLSADEHKVLTKMFAEHLESDGRANPQLTYIAESFEPHQYASWINALKLEVGLFREWGTFRVARITELFAQRIKLLTADDAVRIRLISEFEADYLSLQFSKPGSSTAQLTPAAAPMAITRTTDHGTRQVLARAIETLDDSQIAKILVPLDVVAALLVQRKQ